MKQENKYKINKTLILNNLKVIKEYIKEGTFILNDNGLKFCEMDPANVALITLNINKTEFINFVNVIEFDKFSLNIEEFYKSLNLFDDSKISFYLDSENIYLNDSETNIKIKLLDLEEPKTKIPTLEFDYKYKVNSKDFISKILKIKPTEENETFKFISTEEDKFIIQNETFNNKIDFNIKDQEMLKNENKTENNYSKYSITYLQKLKNIKLLDKYLIVKFRGDIYPLMIQTQNLNFILAPKQEY